jgi:hypothetical protein
MAFLNLVFLNPYPKEVGFNLIQNDGEEDKTYKEACEEENQLKNAEE